MDVRVQRVLFAGTSRLTDVAPVFGARLLDALLLPTAGSRALSALFARRNRRVMRRAGALRRFLVIPDIHIGDAVMTQSALTALRDYFPDAEIDYVINRAVAPIIEGNPDATRIMPIFSGAHLPDAADLGALRDTIRSGGYDLCLSFGSFMEPEDITDGRQPFISFLTHAPTLLRNEQSTAQINHFSYQYYRFVRDVLGMVARPVRGQCYQGVRATFSDRAIGEASRYAAETGLSSGAPVIMINPDGACRFTLLPFEQQSGLLDRLAAETTPDTTILLGAGHSWEGVGQRLVDSVRSPLRARLRIIPKSMSLDAYAALMDYADVFITGDTGPLHLAAARRFSRSGHHRFRNRTAVLSLFGATISRLSGYDSSQPGYLAANQDAPSWCYVAGSRCRNVTCLNKYFKTCRAVRCFEGVDVADLAAQVIAHLSAPARPAPARAEPLFAAGGPRSPGSPQA